MLRPYMKSFNVYISCQMKSRVYRIMTFWMSPEFSTTPERTDNLCTEGPFIITTTVNGMCKLHWNSTGGSKFHKREEVSKFWDSGKFHRNDYRREERGVCLFFNGATEAVAFQRKLLGGDKTATCKSIWNQTVPISLLIEVVFFQSWFYPIFSSHNANWPVGHNRGFWSLCVL